METPPETVSKPQVTTSVSRPQSQPVKPAVFSFNESAFETKIKKLKELRDSFAGKKNYNPFFWYRDNVMPHTEAYNKGVRTKELYDAVMNLKEEITELKKPI